jgi:signal transduction histidine kinase
MRVVSGVDADLSAMHALPLESSLAGQVVRSGESLSVSDLAGDPRAVDVSAALGWPRIGPAVVVPLRSKNEVEGALALGWAPQHAHRAEQLDPTLPARFAEQATLALQVGRARVDRQRVELFADRERIGRDLHDLIIQRLFAVGLSLDGLSRLVHDPLVTARLSQAVDDLDDTIKDIRRTIFSLSVLEAGSDVQTEVTRLVDRAAATLKFRPSLSFRGPVRTLVSEHVVPDLLAVLAEALSNVSRHAEAATVDVVLSAGADVVLSVTDDGRGIPEAAPESGLGNMRDRALKHGGSFEVTSAAGRGTTVTWAVPLSSPSG